MFEAIKTILNQKKEEEEKTFLDYSSREKKQIIKNSARDAIKMQKDLIEEYDRKFSSHCYQMK